MTGRSDDHRYMARALRLARRGLFTADPNPRVGCVLVQGEQIVGEGWHERAGGPHAEVCALEQAGADSQRATAYVTLEPCCHHGRTPPCTDTLIAAGVSRVVIGSTDANPVVSGQGAAQLRAAGVKVVTGVLVTQTDALNPGFVSRMTRGRPYLRSKIAASIDGRTALASGESRWITGAAARADVQRIRARSSAILTGIGTVVADDPSLNVRDSKLGPVLSPARVVLDSALRMSPQARLLALPGAVRLFCASEPHGRRDRLESTGAVVEVLPGNDGHVDLDAVLHRLGDLEINEILVEAGPILNGALLAAGLIDELIVYQAAHVIGDAGHGMFSMPALMKMSDRVEFKLSGLRRVGDDCRMTFVQKI